MGFSIDIAMTATRRPELIERTLSSLKLFMLPSRGHRLFLNVDPVGHDMDSFDVVSRFAGYFARVEGRCPETPSFGDAFKWCWSQTDADYVLHLEEDWEFLRPVDVSEMVKILSSEPDLALLRLPAFRSDAAAMKNWNLWYPWNGTYFECPENLKITAGFCGHPSLIKREFVHRTVRWVDPNLNPEKQFHRGGPRKLIEEVVRWKYGVFGSPSQSAAVRDIGREWMVKNGWAKQGPKAFFTKWERAHG